jgi:hypothetical protein
VNSYLVERYLPGFSEADLRAALERVQTACAELSAAGTPIRYGGSLFLALEETCFCRFDSERAETAAEANERAQFPFARITPTIVIVPEEAQKAA